MRTNLHAKSVHPDNDINCFCRHPRLSPVVGQPENGCAFWERESGTDNDERRQP